MPTKCSNCPLRQLDAFAPMTGAEVEFMERFKKGEFNAEIGTEIMAQGQSSTHLFTCLEGMGLLYKTLQNGRRQVIGFVMPGDFVGLQAGVMAEMDHSVEASTPMKLCIFNRSELWSLFTTNPARAYDITRVAAHEERFLGEALAVVGQMDARTRIAWALHRFYTRLVDVGMQSGSKVPLPYKQQDLADALGLSLVHTNKTLTRLREEQIVTWMDNQLTVHNLDRLTQLAQVDTETMVKRPII